jgi:hypothetical protein
MVKMHEDLPYLQNFPNVMQQIKEDYMGRACSMMEAMKNSYNIFV